MARTATPATPHFRSARLALRFRARLTRSPAPTPLTRSAVGPCLAPRRPPSARTYRRPASETRPRPGRPRCREVAAGAAGVDRRGRRRHFWPGCGRPLGSVSVGVQRRRAFARRCSGVAVQRRGGVAAWRCSLPPPILMLGRRTAFTALTNIAGLRFRVRASRRGCLHGPPGGVASDGAAILSRSLGVEVWGQFGPMGLEVWSVGSLTLGALKPPTGPDSESHSYTRPLTDQDSNHAMISDHGML